MRLGGLSANADFLKLWVGQSVSVFGNQVTVVALPLTAVLVLDAGAAEMGFLRAAQSVPILLFSLAVGVWIDRVRRKPLVATSNLGRGLLPPSPRSRSRARSAWSTSTRSPSPPASSR